MPVTAQQQAPDFDLVSAERDEESGGFRHYVLSKALTDGPIVLHFFPAPFTRVCEMQMCDVRDHAEDVYGAQGVQVWGITGHYPWLIRAWDREQHFGVPVLADYEHEVSEVYVGTYPPEKQSGLRHTTKRGVVGISAEGVVRYVWVTEEPGVGPTDEIVQAAIDAAKG